MTDRLLSDEINLGRGGTELASADSEAAMRFISQERERRALDSLGKHASTVDWFVKL